MFRYVNTPGIFSVADPQQKKCRKNAEKKTVDIVMYNAVFFINVKTSLTA